MKAHRGGGGCEGAVCRVYHLCSESAHKISPAPSFCPLFFHLSLLPPFLPSFRLASPFHSSHHHTRHKAGRRDVHFAFCTLATNFFFANSPSALLTPPARDPASWAMRDEGTSS